MTKLVWDGVGEKVYQAGVDRGVIFPVAGGGIVWNGLTNVTETNSGAELTPYYQDGQKYLNYVVNQDFKGIIEAITYPDEFELYSGVLEQVPGVFVTQQQRPSFGLCYRTGLGNDLEGMEYGYRIHLIYNAIALPTDRAYGTINESPTPTKMGWNIDAVPVPSDVRNPTAHIFIDSTNVDPEILSDFEDILYGTDLVDSRMPTQSEIMYMFSDMSTIIDGGTPSSAGAGEYDGGTPFSAGEGLVDGGLAIYA